MDSSETPSEKQQGLVENRLPLAGLFSYSDFTCTEDSAFLDLFMGSYPSAKRTKTKLKEPNTGQKRKRESADDSAIDDLSSRTKSRMAGENAYYIVIVGKAGIQYKWKDPTGALADTNKIEFKDGYNQNRAEFEAKQLHDSYWEQAVKYWNRELIISLGRQWIQVFDIAGSTGNPDHPPVIDEKHLPTSLKHVMLARDVEADMLEKILEHKKWRAEGKFT
ncbi:hypothetical protein F53441_14294 [Fusarium austroafricanum]|uniref:Uncharacterized protein n=1 Tax=Fusarium austroafricanum TaxID=2364996 RepID=A0A8H4NDQ3_9HYPO|nr:hypothetical protein F53441_14294 [Fusarium austroafricanum]